MVDHVRTLLLNPVGVPGYQHVTDGPADRVLAMFGMRCDGSDYDADLLDKLLPLAEAPDLRRFRRFFDPRVTPRDVRSIYRTPCTGLSTEGLYDKILSAGSWWQVAELFQATDPVVLADLVEMRGAASCMDAPFALGAVLLACAYRRLVLQDRGM